jgi:hypothetical protein
MDSRRFLSVDMAEMMIRDQIHRGGGGKPARIYKVQRAASFLRIVKSRFWPAAGQLHYVVESSPFAADHWG